jgi:glycosyltransferase involved in cell wall biosynthesis
MIRPATYHEELESGAQDKRVAAASLKTCEVSGAVASHPTTGKLRPHVLYVIDQLCQLGGAERTLLQIVSRLCSERFQTSVVTFQTNQHIETLLKLSGRLHVLPLRKTYNLNAAKMAFQFNRILRSDGTSIVHTFFETADLWAAPIAKLSGCPILISSRRDMGILRTRKHNLAYPFVNRLFDRVLAVSEEVRSYSIRQDRLSPQKVETLYNGVDIAELDRKAAEGNARQELGLQTGVPVVSTLANIRSIKGIDVLVGAAQRVCIEFPQTTFLVVGRVLEPETMVALQAQVDSLRLTDNFRFTGEMGNPFPVLRASNVFCLPSRNEGFSNALIEAMGSGLPCIATRVGGNAEALEEGENGYLVASEDANAMADRILGLLRDRELAKQIGSAARVTVRERFSMEAMMNRLMGIYDELLAAKHV